MRDASLDGVVVAKTSITMVDGKRGITLVRGYRLADLAAKCTYEQIAYLVLHGELPNGAEYARFCAVLSAGAVLTQADEQTAQALAHGRHLADALAAAMILADDAEAQSMSDIVSRAERVLGRVPAVCGAVAGVAQSPQNRTYAERSLRALGGKHKEAPAVRALEVLLGLESEHGLSASTFACRVAASSGASAGASLAAAVATLSGPRHGGATAEARQLLIDARASGDVAALLRDRQAKKLRLAGFGHRVYKVPDPRLPPLRAAMRAMPTAPLFEVAEALDREATVLFGNKGVHANIDLFGAALLDALGVEPEEYVAAFALGVACGWLAHWIEQRNVGRLIRPESEYIGPAERPVP